MDAHYLSINKMHISDRILHTCTGHPSYFDVLPADILRYCIAPFLDWEERIHLNMLTPPGDRTPPKKIPKDQILAHQMYVCVHIVSSMLITIEMKRLSPRLYSKRSLVEDIFTLLRSFLGGHNSLFLEYSLKFRKTFIERLHYLIKPSSLRTITRVKQREEMKLLVNTLFEYLASHPYKYDIKSASWL